MSTTALGLSLVAFIIGALMFTYAAGKRLLARALRAGACVLRARAAATTADIEGQTNAHAALGTALDPELRMLQAVASNRIAIKNTLADALDVMAGEIGR